MKVNKIKQKRGEETGGKGRREKGRKKTEEEGREQNGRKDKTSMALTVGGAHGLCDYQVLVGTWQVFLAYNPAVKQGISLDHEFQFLKLNRTLIPIN